MKHLIKQGLRRCYKCKETKPLDINNFSKSSRAAGGLRYLCKPCQSKESSTRGSVQRVRVIDALGKFCRVCKVSHESYSFFDIDHIIPLRRGRGRRQYRISGIGNYQVLCPNCHRKKTIDENGFV